MASVIVFDVNETLLDLSALDPAFEAVFGDRAVRREWFALVLRTGWTGTIIGAYRDFGAVGAAALEMTAEIHGITLAEDHREAILGGMTRLPPHAEVPGALARLRGANYRLAALTNSTRKVARAQLDFAGLSDSFEDILSADTAGALKPAASVYTTAARALGVPPGRMWMIAAHDWDVAGAMRAGCRAGFVARPGMVANPLFAEPDVVADDLDALATRLLERGLD
ncbi:haloacid dehalogenase type II [Yunchengibacter salinarum]|uniref:haloacid dehalogenase type II n=1 Tax=Yunchengibacter salinarum TaxID=3133399 RepID=UPI0035B6205A